MAEKEGLFSKLLKSIFNGYRPHSSKLSSLHTRYTFSTISILTNEFHFLSIGLFYFLRPYLTFVKKKKSLSIAFITLPKLHTASTALKIKISSELISCI